MKSLQEFYNDKDTKNNVHEYLVGFLKEEAVRRVFDKEDVTAVADAKEIIDLAFENMSVLFPERNTKKKEVNEAR